MEPTLWKLVSLVTLLKLVSFVEIEIMKNDFFKKSILLTSIFIKN